MILIKNLIFLILAALTINTSAQLAPVGTKWTMGRKNTQDPTLELKQIYTVVKDTLIGNYMYSFVGEDSNPNGNSASFWRQDSGRVYYNHKGTDYRFFDFNAKLGDTVTVDLTINHFMRDSILKDYKIKITKLDYFKYTTDSLKGYIFERLDSNYASHTLNYLLLEKVCCFRSGQTFFLPVLAAGQVDFWTIFRCYEEPGGLTINFTADGHACETVSIDEIKYRGKETTVYPNPTSSQAFINFGELASYVEKVDLYDQSSTLVFSTHIIHKQAVIMLPTNYSPGVYDLVVTYKDGIRITRKIVVAR